MQAVACLLLIATLIALTPRATQANIIGISINTNQPNRFVACPGTNVCFGTLIAYSAGCNGNVSIKWYFGDPNSGVAPVAYGAHFCYTFNSPGLYHVSVVATDLNCGGSASNAVDFHCGDSSISSISAGAGCGSPYGTIDFSASATGNCSNVPLSYTWNFGDGSSATGPNPTHFYSPVGKYLVQVTVSDGAVNLGSSSFYTYPCQRALSTQPTADASPPSDQNN